MNKINLFVSGFYTKMFFVDNYFLQIQMWPKFIEQTIEKKKIDSLFCHCVKVAFQIEKTTLQLVQWVYVKVHYVARNACTLHICLSNTRHLRDFFLQIKWYKMFIILRCGLYMYENCIVCSVHVFIVIAKSQICYRTQNVYVEMSLAVESQSYNENICLIK